LIGGSPFSDFRRRVGRSPVVGRQLLRRSIPGKIICVGRNYAAHAAEHDADVPALPLLFSKPPSAVIGPGDPILLPPQSQRVEHEAELAVVIGQRARWISPEEASGYILGYTAERRDRRDLQNSDGQWTRAGFDTRPLGPWIDTPTVGSPGDLPVR
jgi:2-keto-4-pentenoate hydratase/2-oxohepta-3-ene-1,7-dioic acid hydratase in catechol pathway